MSCILFILNSKKRETVNRQFFLVIFGNTKFCFIKDKKVKKALIKRNETIFYIDDKTSKYLDERNMGYKIMKEVLSKPKEIIKNSISVSMMLLSTDVLVINKINNTKLI